MAEIEVTEAMLRAGFEVVKLVPSDSAVQFFLADIYRAMRALEPTQMDDAESRRLAALEIAVRLGPSQKDLVPLARATELYLRGENTEVVLPNAVDVTANPPASPTDGAKDIWQTFANDLTNFCRSRGVMLWTKTTAMPIMATLATSENSVQYEIEQRSEADITVIIRPVLGR